MEDHLHVHVHLTVHGDGHHDQETRRNVAEILQRVRALQREEEEMAADLTKLQNEVTRNTSVLQSAKTLINGLAAQIQAAQNDPTAIQAIVDQLQANDDDLAGAIAANTPAAPPAA